MSNVKELNTSSGSFNFQKNSPLLSSNSRSVASENTSLSASQEILRSYGATRKPELAPCNYTTVRHVLEPGDTLQGLAIKYQVTVEQIKRANRLWTHDNIHLQVYKELKIPVKLDSTYKVNRTICRTNSTEIAETSVSLNDVEFVDGCDNNIETHGSSSSHERDQNLQDNGQTSNEGDSAVMNTNSQSLQNLLDQIDARIQKSVKESRKLRDVSGPKVLELLEKSNQQSLEDNELWRPWGNNKERRSRQTKVQRASVRGTRKRTSLQDSDDQFFEL